MSYDIDLKDPVTKQVITIEDAHFMRGGTYQLGGSNELSLNMTYNYGKILHRVIANIETPSKYKSGVRAIYGLTGQEAIPVLEAAVAQLGDDIGYNYWEATEGNVKKALLQLLTMSKMRPDGVWDGD